MFWCGLPLDFIFSASFASPNLAPHLALTTLPILTCRSRQHQLCNNTSKHRYRQLKLKYKLKYKLRLKLRLKLKLKLKPKPKPKPKRKLSSKRKFLIRLSSSNQLHLCLFHILSMPIMSVSVSRWHCTHQDRLSMLT